MMGKVLAAMIVLSALAAGGAMYYLQVYGYYTEVTASGIDDVQMTPVGTSTPETILYEDFQAIDADSSPIRYRACFTTPTSVATLTETYEIYDGGAPRVAPGWFDCFDAEEIGTLIDQGRAVVFVGKRNLEFGIDRVVAVADDGRGFVWHEVNDCGDKTYDGSPLGDDCPVRNLNDGDP